MDELTKDYKEYLYERLQDPVAAAGYLNATLEEDDPSVFLLALKYVVEARGISSVAAIADLDRANLYRILSDQGNPRLSSVLAIFQAVDIQLQVKPRKAARKRTLEAAMQPSLFEQPAGFKEPRIVGGFGEHQESDYGSTDNTKNESFAA
jgi:probable addiction module antidote protein